jgi:hypothetical protein
VAQGPELNLFITFSEISGDILDSIDGVNVQGSRLSQVASLLLGEEDTLVIVGVRR